MTQFPLAATFFDNNECKNILNSMNLRLNDINLKLSLILEVLANRLSDQRGTPQTVISEEAPTQSFTYSATNSTSDKTTSRNLFQTESKTEDFDGDQDMEAEEDTKEPFENEGQPKESEVEVSSLVTPLHDMYEFLLQDEKVLDDGPFPEGAVRRAAKKAAKYFQGAQPKVFAWQLLRETVTDEELRNVQISLRTYHGENADHLLGRQLLQIRLVVDATMKYFKWDQLSTESQLSKVKLILSHLKNNTKVRNWTLREGRSKRVAPPTLPVNDVNLVWKRYLALLGSAGPGILPKLSSET
ncbi:hypothetical protein CAEBREN_08827 [Caenorhabditis brenneri]|uniref:Uncharacterized protein n=1 Tax=Caenorhabditis brenneri TaxID=135651 RepID=G0PLY4_CAEBE|nr:hypothetical protein CAEBREN_08827 [Caenorhabditis brenneri]